MIGRTARRFLSRAGESVTLRNFTQTGTDDYGDPVFDSSTESASVVIRLPGEPETVTNAAGVDVGIDARAWIPTDATVHEPRDDHPKPTVIERENGDQLKVMVVFEDDNGLYRCECSRHDR